MIMIKKRIAILGAGRIGFFHAREFNKANCEVVAILGQTEISSKEKAEKLHSAFGINPTPYCSLEKLLKEEKLDAVSVCTPSNLHFQHTKKCLSKGLNVFCEKPLVLDSCFNNYKKAKYLFELAHKKNKILTVNTQLVYLLDQIPKKITSEKISSFSMFMEPNFTDYRMICEGIPHMNSLLIRLIPNGKIRNIHFAKNSEKEIDLQFEYTSNSNVCNVNYFFRHKEERPRKMWFSINGEEFSRQVKNNNEQTLNYDNAHISIKDPLEVSISYFISALMENKNYLLRNEEILKNIKLQDKIIKEYLHN